MLLIVRLRAPCGCAEPDRILVLSGIARRVTRQARLPPGCGTCTCPRQFDGL